MGTVSGVQIGEARSNHVDAISFMPSKTRSRVASDTVARPRSMGTDRQNPLGSFPCKENSRRVGRRKLCSRAEHYRRSRSSIFRWVIIARPFRRNLLGPAVAPVLTPSTTATRIAVCHDGPPCGASASVSATLPRWCRIARMTRTRSSSSMVRRPCVTRASNAPAAIVPASSTSRERCHRRLEDSRRVIPIFIEAEWRVEISDAVRKSRNFF